MKKSLILLPLCAAMLCSCGGGGSTTGESSQPVAGVVYDFSSLTGTGNELETAEAALTTLTSCVTSGTNVVTAATPTKVYDGGGSGGCHEKGTGLLKFGTSSVNGSLVITLSKKITKVVVNVHDFYKPTTEFPTNSNSVSINGSEQLCPFNDEGTGGDLSFTIDATDTLTIEGKNSGKQGGRFYLWKLTLE